jgi:hypothetical protein
MKMSLLWTPRLTMACTRPRNSSDVIENLPLITLIAQRVMPGVMPLRLSKLLKHCFMIPLC